MKNLFKVAAFFLCFVSLSVFSSCSDELDEPITSHEDVESRSGMGVYIVSLPQEAFAEGWADKITNLRCAAYEWKQIYVRPVNGTVMGWWPIAFSYIGEGCKVQKIGVGKWRVEAPSDYVAFWADSSNPLDFRVDEYERSVSSPYSIDFKAHTAYLTNRENIIDPMKKIAYYDFVTEYHSGNVMNVTLKPAFTQVTVYKTASSKIADNFTSAIGFEVVPSGNAQGCNATYEYRIAQPGLFDFLTGDVECLTAHLDNFLSPLDSIPDSRFRSIDYFKKSVYEVSMKSDKLLAYDFILSPAKNGNWKFEELENYMSCKFTSRELSFFYINGENSVNSSVIFKENQLPVNGSKKSISITVKNSGISGRFGNIISIGQNSNSSHTHSGLGFIANQSKDDDDRTVNINNKAYESE